MDQFLAYFEDTTYIGIIVYIALATILLLTLFVGSVLLCNPFLTEKISYKSVVKIAVTICTITFIISFLLTHYHYKNHKYTDDTITSIQENYHITQDDNKLKFQLKTKNQYYKDLVEFEVKKTINDDNYILTDINNQNVYLTITSEDLKNITTPNYKDNKEDKDRKLNIIDSTIKLMFGI